MNAYIIAHAPVFLPAQLAGLKRAYGRCDVTVVAPRGSGKKLAPFATVLKSPTHGPLPIWDWLYDHASDGPSLFLEYDVVPVAPVYGNWMNQRGIQERGQASPMGGLWPAAFGWESKSAFRREFFRTLKDPFAGEWRTLIQDRAAVRGGLPECADESDFRMIGSELLHYVNGSGRPSAGRNACFSECLRTFGIEWSRPGVVATPADRQPSGPGVELKALLKTIGIVASPNCSCNKRAKIMDEKGCDWCAEHIEEIDGWLAEEAKKRKLPYLSLAGKTLIRLAIHRARKKGNGSV